MAAAGSAIVCDRLRLYGNSSLCDRLRSAIVCDRLRSYGNQPLARVPCIRQELLKFKLTNQNRPFSSCCLSRFRSESWGLTIVREMSLICIRIRNSFPFEWLCPRTRFETEAYINSEMGYSSLGKNCAIRRPVNCLQLTGPKNRLEDFVATLLSTNLVAPKLGCQ